MNSRSGMKKMSVILTSIAVTLSGISLSSFATTDTEGSVGMSSASTSEENMIEKSEPKIITLDKPGDYRLIGSDVSTTNLNDPNQIVVNSEDKIVIEGPGTFNVTLDNVNIDIGKEITNRSMEINDTATSRAPYSERILDIKWEADVNLILEGKNILKDSRNSNRFGIYAGYVSRLTITEGSEGSSLSILDLDCSISCNDITIKDGTIELAGRDTDYNSLSCHSCAVSSPAHIVIDGGTLDADNLDLDNVIINGGNIKADLLNVNDSIEINNANVETDQLHVGKQLNINGGNIKADQLDVYGSIEINNANVETNQLYVGKQLNINGGKIDGVTLEVENVIINGGTTNLKTISVRKSITMSGGELIINCINNVALNRNIRKLLSSDVSTWGINADFYIIGGRITNDFIDFAPCTSANTSTNSLPFSSQFPTQSSGDEFRDTQFIFEFE